MQSEHRSALQRDAKTSGDPNHLVSALRNADLSAHLRRAQLADGHGEPIQINADYSADSHDSVRLFNVVDPWLADRLCRRDVSRTLSSVTSFIQECPGDKKANLLYFPDASCARREFEPSSGPFDSKFGKFALLFK